VKNTWRSGISPSRVEQQSEALRLNAESNTGDGGAFQEALAQVEKTDGILETQRLNAFAVVQITAELVIRRRVRKVEKGACALIPTVIEKHEKKKTCELQSNQQ
jgi:hypothetical protein